MSEDAIEVLTSALSTTQSQVASVIEANSSLSEAVTSLTEITSSLSQIGGIEGSLSDGGSVAAYAAISSSLSSTAGVVESLQSTVAALPAPYDPSSLEERVSTLEQRNATDDSIADVLTGNVGAGVIVLSPATLPDPVVGAAYSATLLAQGSAALPFQFSIASGALPPGLSLSAGGLISGTPTEANTFNVTIQAHDANNVQGELAYTLVVDAEPLLEAPV